MLKKISRITVLLALALFFILLNFFIHISRTIGFNNKNRIIHAFQSIDNCILSIAPRQGITDTWDKVDVVVDGKVTTLKGVTYDASFSNGNPFVVNKWNFRINFETDCFINNAWNGNMEIHQFSGKQEKVQTVDLRNIDKSLLELDYITIGQDVLIRLHKGDYVIYCPNKTVNENLVRAASKGFAGSVVTGFILYFEKTPTLNVNLNDYIGSFKFSKKYFEGKEPRIFIVLSIIWIFIVIVRISTKIATIKTREETEKRLTIQRMEELEKYNSEIKAANEKLAESHSIIKAVADIYYIIYSVNLKDETFYEIKTTANVSNFISSLKNAREVLHAIPLAMFIEEDQKKTAEFYTIENCIEKLKDNDTCFIESRAKRTGWVRTNLIVSQRNEMGEPVNVLFALQNIDEAVAEEFERKKRLEEANRIIQSYNEALNSEVEAKTAHIKEIQEKVVRGLANVIGNRDVDTVGHVNRTSDIIHILLDEYRALNPGVIDDSQAFDIIRAAPMHDLGKIYIDTAILCKPGRFTDEEFARMKLHSSYSGDIVNNVLKGVEEKQFVDIAFNVARHHHERWDGNGYPDRLSGENIPLEARIMAVADVYDALVSKRCYKEPMSFEKAYSIMLEGMGTQFDPQMKDIFLACQKQLEEYYTKSNAAM